MEQIKIGLLEFGKRDTEYSSMGKVLEVIDYAKQADELGFSRFWLAEHHNYSSSEAWSSPQVLLPILLGETEQINVGMAGVLINYYSSYETAVNFKMLENLYPTRVNLGFAAGTPPLKISQLLCQNDFKDRPDSINTKIKEIYEFFYKEDEIAEREKIAIPPFKGRAPEMFMLSNSFNKIDKAIELRLNISKSIFHRSDSLIYQKDEVNQYKERFYQKHGIVPSVSIAFTGTCALTEKRANEIARNSGYKNFFNAIVGTPSQFMDRLSEYQELFGVDEFIFHDVAVSNYDRIIGLQSLSEIFNLNKNKIVSYEI